MNFKIFSFTKSEVVDKVVFLVLGVFSLALFNAWISSGYVNHYGRAEFSALLVGEAERPFIFRQFLPLVSKVVAYFVPESFEKILIQQQDYTSYLLGSLKLANLSCVLEFTIALFLCYAGFFAGLFFVYLTYQRLFDSKWRLALLAAVYAGALLPLFFYKTYIYDPVTFFFSSAIIYSLAAKKIKLFYVLYFLGLFNKETTVLFSALFVINYYSEFERSEIIRHFVFQLLIFTGVYSLLYFLYAGHEGAIIENHFYDNVWACLTFYYLRDIRTLAAIIFILLLVFYQKVPRPMLLQGAVVMPVLLFPLFLYGGVWGEFRVFLEAHPLLSILTFNSLIHLTTPNSQ